MSYIWSNRPDTIPSLAAGLFPSLLGQQPQNSSSNLSTSSRGKVTPGVWRSRMDSMAGFNPPHRV